MTHIFINICGKRQKAPKLFQIEKSAANHAKIIPISVRIELAYVGCIRASTITEKIDINGRLSACLLEIKI